MATKSASGSSLAINRASLIRGIHRIVGEVEQARGRGHVLQLPRDVDSRHGIQIFDHVVRIGSLGQKGIESIHFFTTGIRCQGSGEHLARHGVRVTPAALHKIEKCTLRFCSIGDRRIRQPLA